mgnify:CR=1 FL=1
MSRSKDKIAFLTKHPYCCLCGGDVASDSVEHSPPRALFVDRDAKGAFRSPACNRCNCGSRENDQVAALASLIMGAATASHVPNSYVEKLLQGVANNSPDFIRMIGAVQSPELLRINGLVREVFPVNMDSQIYPRWLLPWAAKLSLAFWYHHTHKILNSEGRIFVHWISNADSQDNQEFFEQIQKALPGNNHVKQGKVEYPNQFRYLYGISDDSDFGSFGFILHESAFIWAGIFENRARIDAFRGMPIYKTSAEEGIELDSFPIR